MFKSVQTGWVTSFLNGSGEDFRYADVNISSVNTNKSYIYVVSWRNGFYDPYPAQLLSCSGRFLSSTTIRISYDYGGYGAYGRWYVIEFY